MHTLPEIKKAARKAAGYRERYAMDHGTLTIKHSNRDILFVYTYSNELEYQDANGATYSVNRGAWVN